MKPLLLALAAALAATPALAQPAVVNMQLDSVVSLMAGDGYAPVDDAVRGTLASGDEEEYELDLERGVHYAIIGFCDGGCTDLDLALVDEDGDAVASDYALDDYPVLEFDAAASGTYVLTVDMATCSREQCHYGVRVFRRR